MNNLLRVEPTPITDFSMRYDDETRELKGIRKAIEVLCNIILFGVGALLFAMFVLCVFAM